MRWEIARYAEGLGLRIARVVSEEEGVLPVVLDGDIEAFWKAGGAIPRSGLRAALFHPTTGYSLAEAAGLALAVTEAASDAASLFQLTRERSTSLWRRSGFLRLLNRMLFRAALPEERYRVLRRFYALAEPLIERFYADRSTLADKVRLLTGRPPVPVARALACLFRPARRAPRSRRADREPPESRRHRQRIRRARPGDSPAGRRASRRPSSSSATSPAAAPTCIRIRASPSTPARRSLPRRDAWRSCSRSPANGWPTTST